MQAEHMQPLGDIAALGVTGDAIVVEDMHAN